MVRSQVTCLTVEAHLTQKKHLKDKSWHFAWTEDS